MCDLAKLIIVMTCCSVLPLVKTEEMLMKVDEEVCQNKDGCSKDMVCLDSDFSCKVKKYFDEMHVDTSGDDENDLTEEIKQQEIKLTSKLDIGNGNRAWVIDNAINMQAAQLIFQSLEFPVSLYGYTFNHMNYSKGDDTIKWNHGDAPWSKEFNLQVFEKTQTWKKLSSVVENVLKAKVKLEYGQVELLRTMDVMPPVMGKYCSPNRYILTIFLNKMWNLNNYGQVSFYANMSNPHLKGGSRLEIVNTVHPHAHRAILWPSCHTVLFRSPCVNFYQPLKYINIWLTTETNSGAEKIDAPASHAKNRSIEMEEFGQFKFTNSDRNVDFREHLTRTFNDGDPSRRVYIFDDLFTTDELRQWRTHLLRFRAITNGFDTAPLEDHDNVLFVAQYDVKGFMQTDMWPRLSSLCHYVSNQSSWHPYDVALNYVRSSDHTRIHPDSEPHEDELTMVLYLNEGLTPSDYGETTFFVPRNSDGVHEFIGPGGEMYEAIGTVTPKFGRVVIFTNNIEHSAHPPGNEYFGGRYTFALKVSKNHHLAMVKIVYEKMEHVELDDFLTEFNQNLVNGYLDDPSLISLATLETVSEKLTQTSHLRMEKLRKATAEKILEQV